MQGSFTHNGGVWTRPDIPSGTEQIWKCCVCNKVITSQEEQYQIHNGIQIIDKARYIPISRYWHGYTVGIEFCSIDCSFNHYGQK